MGVDETVYCINCGDEISVSAEFCPECGSSQEPNQMKADKETTERSTFTSWAPGFKPESIFRNIVVGIMYIIFFQIGVFVLAYGYLKENPESGSTFAGALGILLILVGIIALTGGSARDIVGGIITIVVGIVSLPATREKFGFGNPPPGIKKKNTARKNALISIGYGIGVLLIVASALP